MRGRMNVFRRRDGEKLIGENEMSTREKRGKQTNKRSCEKRIGDGEKLALENWMAFKDSKFPFFQFRLWASIRCAHGFSQFSRIFSCSSPFHYPRVYASK